MFKDLWNYFKNDCCWKNTMKVCVVYSVSGVITFLCLLTILVIIGTTNNFSAIDWSFYQGLYFIFQSVFISYSLSVFVVNSTEIQQQKYRFLWLFLFILGLNILGIISILMLMKKQKIAKNIVIDIQEIPVMVKPEKWFLMWAIYSSIIMMVCIVTIPLSIINLINIKKLFKKQLIEIKTLKKISYFSSDWTLMVASTFAF